MLLLLFIASSLAWFDFIPPIYSKDCKFERPDCYACLKQFVDVNPKDEQITKLEIDQALARYMPTVLKPIMYWIKTQDTIDKCDFDKNGVITDYDWEMSNKTCIPMKESYCTVEWFCERARSESNSA